MSPPRYIHGTRHKFQPIVRQNLMRREVGVSPETTTRPDIPREYRETVSTNSVCPSARMCNVKAKVDLEVDIIDCDIVEINCVDSSVSCFKDRPLEIEDYLDDFIPMTGDTMSSPGVYTSRRTVRCGYDQTLEVVLDITYRVRVRGCHVIEVHCPEVEFEIPMPHVNPHHLR